MSALSSSGCPWRPARDVLALDTVSPPRPAAPMNPQIQMPPSTGRWHRTGTAVSPAARGRILRTQNHTIAAAQPPVLSSCRRRSSASLRVPRRGSQPLDGESDCTRLTGNCQLWFLERGRRVRGSGGRDMAALDMPNKAASGMCGSGTWIVDSSPRSRMQWRSTKDGNVGELEERWSVLVTRVRVRVRVREGETARRENQLWTFHPVRGAYTARDPFLAFRQGRHCCIVVKLWLGSINHQ